MNPKDYMICHIKCSCQYLADESASYVALWNGDWCSLSEPAVQLSMLVSSTHVDCGIHAPCVPLKLESRKEAEWFHTIWRFFCFVSDVHKL